MREGGYQLAVAFTDQSPSFALGFAVGRLYEAMASGNRAEIEETTHFENREIIRRIADHLGWTVEVEASNVAGWDYTRLAKARRKREAVLNPHGLQSV